MKQLEILKSLGYRVEERGSDDFKQRINDTDKLVIWWYKGYKPFGGHYKCDGPGPKYWIETVGPSFEECMQNFIDYIQIQDEQK